MLEKSNAFLLSRIVPHIFLSSFACGTYILKNLSILILDASLSHEMLMKAPKALILSFYGISSVILFPFHANFAPLACIVYKKI